MHVRCTHIIDAECDVYDKCETNVQNEKKNCSKISFFVSV